MKNIFIGFLLIFLDFTLNLGSSRIDLIPDFLGYMIMLNGLTEMAEESTQFLKARGFVIGMGIYSGILFALDLLGLSISFGALNYLLSIVSIVISLYISYTIVIGVKEMEEKYQALFNGDRLKSAWVLMAVFNLLSYVSLWIVIAAVVFTIMTLIVTIYFLVAFNNSKNLYYSMVEGH